MPRNSRSRASAKSSFTEAELKAFRYFRRFREVLARVQEQRGVPLHESFADPKRLLHLGDYLCLFLLGLFNPVARTLRGLHQASRLSGVQRSVCRRPVSLGSFSEAQHLVDPAVLQRVFAELSAQVPDNGALPPHLRNQRWMARDSSLFDALPRMSWALYGGGRKGFVNNALRLHLSYDLLKDAPAVLRLSTGKGCERAALREDLKAGDAYVGDRYYGEHYAFLTLLSVRKCRYVIRLVDKQVKFTLSRELPVSSKDKAAGVQRQALGRLGSEGTLSQELRVIWFRGVGGQLLMLATNMQEQEMSAGDVALLYKFRWQVEYFFRWVKCLMGCGHWIAESPQGAAIQLYLALIGALLLQLDLGRRPSKRLWELIQWYLMGMVDEATLEKLLRQQLEAEEKARQKAAAKKRA